MEGILCPEIQDYFQKQLGLSTTDEVIAFLDPDIRWTTISYTGPPDAPLHVQPDSGIYSEPVSVGPLYDATRVEEVEKFAWPEETYLTVPDVKAARAFPGVCSGAAGMEAALPDRL